MAIPDPLEVMKARIPADDPVAKDAYAAIEVAYLQLVVDLKRLDNMRKDVRGKASASEMLGDIKSSEQTARQTNAKTLRDNLKDIGIDDITAEGITGYLSKISVKAGPAK